MLADGTAYLLLLLLLGIKITIGAGPGGCPAGTDLSELPLVPFLVVLVVGQADGDLELGLGGDVEGGRWCRG